MSESIRRRARKAVNSARVTYNENKHVLGSERAAVEDRLLALEARFNLLINDYGASATERVFEELITTAKTIKQGAKSSSNEKRKAYELNPWKAPKDKSSANTQPNELHPVHKERSWHNKTNTLDADQVLSITRDSMIGQVTYNPQHYYDPRNPAHTNKSSMSQSHGGRRRPAHKYSEEEFVNSRLLQNEGAMDSYNSYYSGQAAPRAGSGQPSSSNPYPATQAGYYNSQVHAGYYPNTATSPYTQQGYPPAQYYPPPAPSSQAGPSQQPGGYHPRFSGSSADSATWTVQGDAEDTYEDQ
ncbi:hypothetical protein MIND_00425000 [Mycena indigotica]|uniref:Uncharacterized protein n=1 Tax=Mycena indigotica TaxID=2126181 RepID=A0A8H6SW26_9AGAR|nr:uncharacterized protein MIND_00425000 [Mycena indigotica]KAF7306338.1 hypothetical protein MIND_00425000 [Mycena indigotica]